MIRIAIVGTALILASSVSWAEADRPACVDALNHPVGCELTIVTIDDVTPPHDRLGSYAPARLIGEKVPGGFLVRTDAAGRPILSDGGPR